MPRISTATLINVLGSIAAIIVALIAGGVVISIAGQQPLEAYRAMLNGSINGKRAISETLVYSCPLILGGLSFAVALRAGMFNIGIEGQLMIGGLAAGLVGALDLGLPASIHLPLALLAAMAAGGIWGAIPGVMKWFSGAHEVISTIMLNYLAYRLTQYVVQKTANWLPVQPSLQATKKVMPAARLPKILDGTRLHAGIIVAVVAAFVLWFLLFRTTFGYKVRTVGLSRGAAAYGGINWGLTITLAMLASGILAGLAGAGETLGLQGRQYTAPQGYGFTAIAVGLVGRNNPIGIIFAGILFGALNSGAPSMQASAGVSKEITQVLQGLVILAVAGFAVLNRSSLVRKLLTPDQQRGTPVADRSATVGSEPEVEITSGPPAL